MPVVGGLNMFLVSKLPYRLWFASATALLVASPNVFDGSPNPYGPFCIAVIAANVGGPPGCMTKGSSSLL
jgi:hypothetical protein